MLRPHEGELAVRLARRSLVAHLLPGRTDRGRPTLSDVFRERRGAFVTWKLVAEGSLRGCIGYPLPVLPLAEAIERAAVSAAVDDPRFVPVAPPEVSGIFAEVSVLGVPRPLAPEERARAVRPGVDGLVVASGGRSGLLLPQVATEQGWGALELLDGTCEKAGLPRGAWRRPSVDVRAFDAEVFRERSPDGPVERVGDGPRRA